MPEARTTLSLSLIVRNEALHLERLLRSARRFADEIVVLDTGSTDGSREIAREHGAVVPEFVWCDDFARARNESLSHCTADFVMWLDADDIVEEEGGARLRDLFEKPIGWDVLYLPYYYNYSPEAGRRGKRKMPPRIWRNGIGIHWVYPIHEHLVYPRGVRKERGVTGIEILHHPLGDADVKSDRNLRIMQAALRRPEYRNDDYILWHLAKEHSQLGNPRRAAEYFRQALRCVRPEDRFRTARLHFGLARQCRRMGQYLAALQSATDCAIAYSDWREPYCEMAEALIALGDVQGGEMQLKVAEGIGRHSLQVERAELYTGEGFGRFRHRIMKTPVPALPAGEGRPAGPSRADTISLIAGGDVCLGRQLPGLVERDGAARPFEAVRAWLLGADLVLVNLESVASNVGDFVDKKGRRPFYYRHRPELLDLLVEAGVRAVTVANNHAMDYGVEAFEQQMDVLAASGIAACGGGADYREAARPVYLQIKGRVIAIVGVETETPGMAATGGQAGINQAPERKLLRRLAPAIATARLHADTIIVSPHWGQNWVENASAERRSIAKSLIDLGADAVLGHSAHILHGIEVYRGRPIVYDMGTLLFDRVGQNRLRQSALFELNIGDRGVERLRIRPLWLQPGRAEPAAELEGGLVRSLLVRLSEELEPGIVLERDGDDLVLELDPEPRPGSLPRLPLPPERTFGPADLRPVPKFYRDLPGNLEYAEVPAGAAFSKAIEVTPWLQVLGGRAASAVRPGYGFVCETFFQAERPPAGRWEACLTAVDERGVPAFAYTHPVAEGAVPSGRWGHGRVIGDRVVVRPPADLAVGRYRLFWRLVDRDGAPTNPCSAGDERLQEAGVYLGDLIVATEAMAGVAGIPPNPIKPSAIVAAEATAGPVRDIQEGRQCTVYLFAGSVLKRLKNVEEARPLVARDLGGDPREVMRLSRTLLERAEASAALLESRAVPANLTGGFERIGQGLFRQERVRPWEQLVQELAGRGEHAGIRDLLYQYVNLIAALWRHGIHETSWRFSGVFGVTGSGRLVLMDCLELSGERGGVEADLHAERWRDIVGLRRFVPPQLAAEFLEMCKERFTVAALGALWRRTGRDLSKGSP